MPYMRPASEDEGYNSYSVDHHSDAPSDLQEESSRPTEKSLVYIKQAAALKNQDQRLPSPLPAWQQKRGSIPEFVQPDFNPSVYTARSKSITESPRGSIIAIRKPLHYFDALASGDEHKDDIEVVDAVSPILNTPIVKYSLREDGMPWGAFREDSRQLISKIQDLVRQSSGLTRSHSTEDSFNSENKTESYCEIQRQSVDWQLLVGDVCISMLRHLVNIHGYGDSKHVYLDTKALSIYLWWRVCTLSSDLAHASSHCEVLNHSEKRDQRVDIVTQLLQLYGETLRADILRLEGHNDSTAETIVHSTCQNSDIGGFISINELLEQRDCFYQTPNLHDLPLPEAHYRTLGRKDSLTRCGETFGQDSKLATAYQEHLLSLFKGFPILEDDYRYLLSQYPSSQARYEDSVAYSIKAIDSNQPFRKWVKGIDLRSRPGDPLESTNMRKEIYRIYQLLLRGTESIGKLYNRLRLLLASQPELFTQFNTFVSTKLLKRWKAAGDSIKAENQVLDYKRRLKLEWFRLVTEEVAQRRDLPSMNRKDSEMEMHLLGVAMNRVLPHRSTSALALATIDELRERYRAAVEFTLSAFEALRWGGNADLESKYADMFVVPTVGDIKDELKKGGVPAVEKEGVDVYWVKRATKDRAGRLDSYDRIVLEK